MAVYRQRKITLIRGLEIAMVCLAVLFFSIYTAQTLVSRGYEEQLSADEQLAIDMTQVLQTYLETSYVGGDLTAPEIRTIIASEIATDFVTERSQRAFWYNLDTQEIFVGVDYEFFDLQPFAESKEPGEQLEEIIKGYLLLDRSSSPVARLLHTLRNATSKIEVDNAIAYLGIYQLGDHANRFAIHQSIRVNDFFTLSTVRTPIAASQVLFAEDITIIPNDAFTQVGTNMPQTLRLPVSVTTILQGAFTALANHTQVLHDTLETLEIELQTFAEDDMLNDAFRDREGTTDIAHIAIRFSYMGSVTRFYQDEKKDQYLGKVERLSPTKYAYYDQYDQLLGFYEAQMYLNNEKEEISSGSDYENLVQLIALFKATWHAEHDHNQFLTWTIQAHRNKTYPVISVLDKTYHFTDYGVRVTLLGYDETQR